MYAVLILRATAFTEHYTLSLHDALPIYEQVEFCQAFTNKFDKFDAGWQQANHYVLMLMLGIVRLGGDPTWSPPQVDVQTGESAVLRDAEPPVAARLAFGQPATTITLPATLLRQRLPPPSADVQMP